MIKNSEIKSKVPVGIDILAAANIDEALEIVDWKTSFSGCTSFCISVSSIFRELPKMLSI